MRSARIFWFITCILVGFGAGLIYGWFINPTLPQDTSLPELRADFKTDYVLMTAEIFRAEGNPANAALRLLRLNGSDLLVPVQEAILTAQERGYNSTDITLLADLASAMLAWQSQPVEEGQ